MSCSDECPFRARVAELERLVADLEEALEEGRRYAPVWDRLDAMARRVEALAPSEKTSWRCMACKDEIDPTAPKCRCYPNGWPSQTGGVEKP